MHEMKQGNHRQSCVKLGLAIGLTVAFIVVVIYQVKACCSSGTSLQESSLDRTSLSSGSSTQEVPAETILDSLAWPEVDLSECMAHDPFAAPEGFVAKEETSNSQTPSAEARQKELELAQKRAAQQRAISELRDVGVNAVFVGPNYRTAIVGTQRLEVGKEIHGHRVVAIDRHGVVLEPIEPVPASLDR